MLEPAAVRLDAVATGRDDAIRQCGEALLAVGAIDSSYVDSMIQRERSISTYVGEGVAIPHGTLDGKESVRRDALSFVRFPDGVDWDGNLVQVCIGIAAKGDGHIGILSSLARILMDPAQAKTLRETNDAEAVIELLAPVGEDEDE
ncbi:PTS sugar transporter subunit IIA [Streptosporangiaceae bacterium NEAU-GS5]|nr:PTS sugar transporter subunit IIA [Streptosporangiaceae bacterium NEAU-GS5]